MSERVKYCFDECGDLSPAEMRELAGLLLDEARAVDKQTRINEARLIDYLRHLRGAMLSLEMIWKNVRAERKPEPPLDEVMGAIGALVAEGKWRERKTAWDPSENDYCDVEIGEGGAEAGRYFLEGEEVAPDDIVTFWNAG